MNSWIILEWIAVVAGFACVLFAALEKIWTWPLGIISVGIFLVIFFHARLYADMTLQVFFLVSGFYGWYNWKYGGKAKDDLPITDSSLQEWVLYLAIGFLSLLGIGYFFDTYTDADLAYWDAYTTAFSLVAQILMAQKKLVNWLLWIAVDLVAIGIYFYKELYPTTILYVGYLILAISGYLVWRKLYREQMSATQQPDLQEMM
ncbi:MAG: nicotinamide riboside transporter PnuC [Bacteroidota bacterium]